MSNVIRKKNNFFIGKSYNNIIIARYNSTANVVTINIHLVKYKLIKRIWKAIMYVFGYNSSNGNFDAFTLHPEDKEKFINVIRKLKN